MNRCGLGKQESWTRRGCHRITAQFTRANLRIELQSSASVVMKCKSERTKKEEATLGLKFQRLFVRKEGDH
jgi:hypothetical protein